MIIEQQINLRKHAKQNKNASGEIDVSYGADELCKFAIFLLLFE